MGGSAGTLHNQPDPVANIESLGRVGFTVKFARRD